MAEQQQGITVSRNRVAELLTEQLVQQNYKLQQQVAELTAVNEALMGRLNEQHNTPANGKALIEGIPNASPNGSPSQ